MGSGSDDAGDLEAVWGREASATAAPTPRLTVPSPGPDDDEEEPSRHRPRRAHPVLVAGAAAAIVAVVTVGVVALVGVLGESPPAPVMLPADEAGIGATTAPPPSTLPTEPAWAADVTCLPLEVGDTEEVPLCPVAADEERAYVLVDVAGAPTVRALDLASGEVAWERAGPAGAHGLSRIEGAVVVLASADDFPYDAEVVVLEPATGSVRWQRPGTFRGPLGSAHVLLDHEVMDGEADTVSTMSVVDVMTGAVRVERTGPSIAMYLHPCAAAGLVLASEGERLTGIDLVDGTELWSVDAVHLDLFQPLACGERAVAFVEGARLRLLDILSGEEIGSTPLAADPNESSGEVVTLSDGAIVVRTSSGAVGFRADPTLEQLWSIGCRRCDDRALMAGPVDDDVVVVAAGRAHVLPPTVGGAGPVLDLDGLSTRHLTDDGLLAWGPAGLVLADPADLGGAVRLDVTDVRQATAGPTHLVVSTADEVRVHPR